MALPEAADARAEEPADVAPGRRDERARGGQADAHVRLPQRAPGPVRDPELQHRDDAAGPNGSRQLPQRRGGIVDVAQEIGERDRIELPVGARQRLRAPLAELDSAAELCTLDAFAADGQHLDALVDADDRPRRRRQGELDRDGARAGGHVQHALRIRGHARDEEPAPARVLSERERTRVAVVRRAERCKEPACLACPRGDLDQGTESTIRRWR